jgi:hypothetical protein
MTFRPVVAGTTDVSVIIRIVDSTDGTPETGVVYNTSGIDLEYRRDGAASVDITEATLSALTDAHADGGFLHIGNGYYRLDLPDAAVASGASGVLVHGTVTGMVVIGTYVPLWLVNPYATGGRVPADVTYWNGSVLTGKTGGFPEFGIIESGTMQSGSAAGTAVLRSATSFPDDLINNATIVIVGGTGVGQQRVIYDWTSSSDTANVSPNWTTTPDNTSVYIVLATPPAPTNVAAIPAVNAVQAGGQTLSASGTVTLPNATLASTTNITAGTITTVTNLTNAPTAGDLTATMKTSIGTAVAASAVASVTGNVGGNVTGSVGSVTGAVGSVTGAVGSVTGNVGGNVTGSVGSIATGGITTASFASGAINAAAIAADAIGASELAADGITEIVTGVLTTAMTEAYPTDGSTMTVAQALYLIAQTIGEFSISGTTLTVRRTDGSTTAATYTLNDATSPTSRTRAS